AGDDADPRSLVSKLFGFGADERQDCGPRAPPGQKLKIVEPARFSDELGVVDASRERGAVVSLLDEDNVGPQFSNIGKAPGQLVPGSALLKVEGEEPEVSPR